MKSLKQYILEADEDEEEFGDTSDDSSDDKDSDNADSAPDKDKGDNEDEGGEKGEHKKKTTRRGEIKFTIWETPDKKVTWLNDNKSYQKIEYKYENKDDECYIDFLLGFKDDSWRLWIGKIGAVSYDDDPYKDLETTKFGEAMVKCLDTVEEFLDDVKEDPDNYVQYYIKR